MALAMTLALAAGGCAAPPPPPPPSPKTTVVLLPDEDGHVGAVSVSTTAGAQIIDTAFTSVTVGAATARPSSTVAGSGDVVGSAYRDLLQAQPSRPRNFVLRFQLDTASLTAESRALLPTLLQAAHDRKPTEITVFGHADAIGTEVRNMKLSADRARTVADLLRKSDPALGPIDVQSFGDKVPLVPSFHGVPEPRNRRVEVQIL